MNQISTRTDLLHSMKSWIMTHCSTHCYSLVPNLTLEQKLTVTSTLYVHTCFCSMSFAEWVRRANCACKNFLLCTNMIYNCSRGVMVVVWQWASVILCVEASHPWHLICVRTLGAPTSSNVSASCSDPWPWLSCMGWPLVGHPLSRLLGDLSISWDHLGFLMPEPGGVHGTVVLLRLGYAGFGAVPRQRGSVRCWMEWVGAGHCYKDAREEVSLAAELVRCPSSHTLGLMLFVRVPPGVRIGPSCTKAKPAWDGGDYKRCFAVNFAWFHC